MVPYGNNYSLEKKVLFESNKNPNRSSSLKFKLIHQIIDTVNISLVILVFTLSFLSFDSQKKWSDTYKVLSQMKENNSNLIDLISKTEEFYISNLESHNSFKKTTPGDLLYFDKVVKKEENIFKSAIVNIMDGIRDSKYQRGY